MHIHSSLPLLDQILDAWRDTLGDADPPYRNHVYRVVNLCLALHPATPDDERKFIIAGCFHDIGLWTDHTVDYLAPSAAVARRYLGDHGLEAWSSEIALMIDQHHKVRHIEDSASPLVEVFRRADWIDVSMGLRRFGLPREDIDAVLAAFPNLGFHKNLLKLARAELFTHRRNPLPMMKW